MTIIRLALPLIFLLLLLAGIYEWSFRYAALTALLVLQAIAAAITLIRKKTRPYKLSRNIFRLLRNSLILILAFMSALLFPPYQTPQASGNHEVLTAKYSWTDDSRIESYDPAVKNRTLTVDFWYPADISEHYPLVVFSHSAFGFSGSNHSTFMKLASKGCVVASLSHTYQAFFTAETQGQITLVDQSFLVEASDINASHDAKRAEEIHNTTKEWMKLRTTDEQFVLDTILDTCDQSDAGLPFPLIDTERIGLMGHSLGGASSARVGRERSDIAAVIVLDGT